MSIVALIAEVKELRATGLTTVDLAKLEQALEETQKSEAASTDAQWLFKFRELTHQSNLAQYEAQHQANMAAYNARETVSLALMQSALTTATDAIKSAMIINGGAGLAVLAYLGNSHSSPTDEFASSLLWFTTGVLLAALCTGGYYFTQYHYAEKKKRVADWFRCVTASLVAASFLLFAVGAYTAYRGFTTVAHYDSPASTASTTGEVPSVGQPVQPHK